MMITTTFIIITIIDFYSFITYFKYGNYYNCKYDNFF